MLTAPHSESRPFVLNFRSQLCRQNGNSWSRFMFAFLTVLKARHEIRREFTLFFKNVQTIDKYDGGFVLSSRANECLSRTLC